MSGTPIRFEKWEGLGNDFVVIRDPGEPLADEVVARLCARRLGVGADGVLLVGDAGGAPRMIVRNADGSRPEMCGNGLRCVAAHLAPGGADALRVATDAGLKACDVRALGGDLFEVTVEMGAARRGADLVVPLDGAEHRFLTVDVGNPHAITFEAYDEGAIDRIGPAVARVPAGGTNVEFCVARPERITVVVWERGVGRTLACGTGACAVAAAACETGRAQFGAPIRVALPGGELVITVAPGGERITMRGPARRVFSGEVVVA